VSPARAALEAAAFGVLLAGARVIPRRGLLALGALVGSLGYLADRRHRSITLDNLRLAYGDSLAPSERRRIARACWRHYGRITLDTLAFPRFSPASVGVTVEVEGVEHLRGAYARGKGVLVFSGHYGHWELTALMQAYLGMPMALVTRPLDNPQLERMLARLRGLSGNVIIHKRHAVREMVRALHQGSGVAIVIDQDARAGGVFVPYFGRPASTTPTLATLALRTGGAVVPAFCVPLTGGRYRITWEPEVEFEATGDRDADVLALTARCTEVIERWVRRHPELWLWMHRRWKTPPPLGPDREEHDEASRLHGS
jgi:Kdo2-lipid IVA lauroyltransferase/acyltransferase